MRTSVASSTDTSNEHETGPSFDSPVPLPPPRPKRWAKKVRAQNMTNQAKDAGQGDGSAKRDTPQSDEWFNSEPKLPMPLFKPTIQGEVFLGQVDASRDFCGRVAALGSLVSDRFSMRSMQLYCFQR